MRAAVQLLVLLSCVTSLECVGRNGNETAAKKFLEYYDHEAMKQFNAYMLQAWNNKMHVDELFKHEKVSPLLTANQTTSRYM